MIFIVLKTLHFISILGVFGSVFGEWLMLKPQLSKKEINLIFKVDAIYGISSIFVVAIGLIMWLSIGKGAEFYQLCGWIYLKLAAFIAVGVLSIFPTVFYFRNRNVSEEEEVEVPSWMRKVILLELIILLIIPFMAVAMVNGYCL